MSIQLSTERIVLREFVKEDWIHVHRYAAQEIVCHYQPWGPNSEEESQAFVEEVLKAADQSPRCRYAFAVILNGEMVGTGELNIEDTVNRVGEISYIVNPNFWGRGIASEVARLLIDYGFKEHQLHRIYATCDTRNIASAKVLEKVGMTKEGRMREDLLLRDGWRDSYLYSVLEHEWKGN